MRKCVALIISLSMAALAQTSMAADVEQTEEISKVLRFGDVGGERLVVVDNLFGAITVSGYDGDEVRAEIRKTVVARSERKAAEARENVQLEITEDDNRIELYVDGPFRERRGHGFEWRGFRHEGYRVRYDFDLKVPKNCAVELITVDDGDISVESIDGDFDVNNVNGGIGMKGMRGSGRVYAVNGKMTVEFIRNPEGDCSFSTINGDVYLYFKPDLSADFYMKTMNGKAFTDFEVSPLPVKTTSSNSENGKKVYRLAHLTGVRAGKGGPEIELHTLNGDMFILRK
jgi:hypothetical protein